MTPNEKQKRWIKKHLPAPAVPLDVVPRAYCVGKPAPGCAVFAMPHSDLRKHLTKKELAPYNSGVIIHSFDSDAVLKMCQGDWATLVYARSSTSSLWYAIPKLMPFSVFAERVLTRKKHK